MCGSPPLIIPTIDLLLRVGREDLKFEIRYGYTCIRLSHEALGYLSLTRWTSSTKSCLHTSTVEHQLEIHPKKIISLAINWFFKDMEGERILYYNKLVNLHNCTQIDVTS